MTILDRLRPQPTVTISGVIPPAVALRGPIRCPDCGRMWPDQDAAFQHVMTYGPEERRKADGRKAARRKVDAA